MSKLFQFCERHYYAAIVLFGVAGWYNLFLPRLRWISAAHLLVMVFSGAALVLGLIGRLRKLRHRDTSAKPQFREWARFPAAIVVAFTASVATGFGLAFIAESLDMTSDSWPVLSAIFAWMFNLLVGFSGVLIGAFCFRRHGRVVWAFVLVILGVSFGILMLGRAHGEFHIPSGAFYTGIGGLLAVAFHWWRKPPNKSLQATAAAPASCD